MRPSRKCKNAGLKSLKELSEISGVPVFTLLGWWKKKRRSFNCMLAGAVAEKTKGDCET